MNERAFPPPLAFIVEGLTEWHCYPSLAIRCLEDAVHLHFPISNAQGNQRLRKNLEGLVENLVKGYHPARIMVGLDARETIREGHFATCAALREELQGRANDWLESERKRSRLGALPDKIVVVIQYQTFENWLVADLEALKTATDVMDTAQISELPSRDLDAEMQNACAWLEQRVKPGIKLKPHAAKRLVGLIRPEVAVTRSRSFAKFCKEVQQAYGAWKTAYGMQAAS